MPWELVKGPTFSRQRIDGSVQPIERGPDGAFEIAIGEALLITPGPGGQPGMQGDVTWMPREQGIGIKSALMAIGAEVGLRVDPRNPGLYSARFQLARNVPGGPLQPLQQLGVAVRVKGPQAGI